MQIHSFSYPTFCWVSLIKERYHPLPQDTIKIEDTSKIHKILQISNNLLTCNFLHSFSSSLIASFICRKSTYTPFFELKTPRVIQKSTKSWIIFQFKILLIWCPTIAVFPFLFPTNLHTGCFHSRDTTLRVVILRGKISRKEVILFHLRLRFQKKKKTVWNWRSTFGFETKLTRPGQTSGFKI